MLSRRLLVSAILIPLAITLFWWDIWLGPVAPIFGVVIALLTALSASEMVTMLRQRLPKLSRVDVVIASTLVVGIGWVCQAASRTAGTSVTYNAGNAPWTEAIAGWLVHDGSDAMQWASTVWFALGVSAMLIGLWTVAWFLKAGVRIERGTLESGEVVPLIAGKLFIIAYVGGLISLTSQIRWLGDDDETSMLLLGALLVGTKLGDVGGYFTGRFLGKTRPLKTLSPKKTIAGFAGALFFGAIAFGTWVYLLSSEMQQIAPRQPWLVYGTLVAFGVVVSGLGIVGDLVESLVKRDCGVKDASQSLPGFGGVLDLIDSPMFAGAVLVCILLVLTFFMVLFS